jgi:MFS family permease
VEQSLGASREWSAWLITVYLIVATIATPAMGRLADLHGRRRMLLIGLGVFTAGSVGAAFAPDTAMLLACRAIQGVGGSVYPLTLAMARGLFRPARAARVIALSAGAFGFGTAAGFVGGGLLAQYASSAGSSLWVLCWSPPGSGWCWPSSPAPPRAPAAGMTGAAPRRWRPPPSACWSR